MLFQGHSLIVWISYPHFLDAVIFLLPVSFQASFFARLIVMDTQFVWPEHSSLMKFWYFTGLHTFFKAKVTRFQFPIYCKKLHQRNDLESLVLSLTWIWSVCAEFPKHICKLFNIFILLPRFHFTFSGHSYRKKYSNRPK